MLFSSVVFILFLPLVLGLYYVLRFSVTLKNMLLLAASLFFYAWGEPRFVLVMLVSIALNYVFALLVDKYRDRRNAAYTIITVMLAANLGMLFVYKYLAFALRIVNESTGFGLSIPHIALPLGISFLPSMRSLMLLMCTADMAVCRKTRFMSLCIFPFSLSWLRGLFCVTT